MRVLNVAEKPSVAKEVTAILSKGQFNKRKGISIYNPVFEFNHPFQGKDATIIFTSVAGHLFGLDFPPEYRNWNSCDPLVLFDAPVRKFVPDSMKDIEATLKREARNATHLVLWLDCDREGENICFEVIETCQQVNSRLQIFRARFSAVIQREIYNAWNNLTFPNQKDALAVDARMELDLRIGASFTRFQTMQLRNKFDGLDGLISYGTCQFPTLGFVVERYLKIQKFIPEDFWQIRVAIKAPLELQDEEDQDFQKGKKKQKKEHQELIQFHWERGRLFDKVSCLAIYEICMENPAATVVEVESKPKRK